MAHKHILIVDDDPLILRTMQVILEDKYIVTMAVGGQNALDLLQRDSGLFDLIICDLNMPDVNGANLYLQLFEKHVGLENRIIFMTGGVFSSFMQTFCNANINTCLIKPFEAKELKEAVDHFFSTTNSGT
jgi:CheY-like chemotaxis protein